MLRIDPRGGEEDGRQVRARVDRRYRLSIGVRAETAETAESGGDFGV